MAANKCAMRRIGRALQAFLVAYVVYLVLMEIFLAVMGQITGGYPETLSPFFWPFAAPFLVLPSHWQLTPLFDNVCSLVGGLLVLVAAIWFYRWRDPQRKKSERAPSQ